MNKRLVGNYIGWILVLEAVFMLPALLIAVFSGELAALNGYIVTILTLAVIGTVLILIRPRNRSFYSKEGFVTVALSWICLSLFGALPFFISGAIPSYIDAFFETVSGFTTTGSSILTEVESMPKSLLYWRSFTHWLGGMGVLVFVLAVMPKSGGNGMSMHILKAESPGPQVGKIVPRMRHTARLLYTIYIILTLAQMVLLLFGGMSLFEAVTTAFGTAGTGGFGIKNDSLASYSTYLQVVTGIFMILFGVNFNIYYLLIMREFRQAFRNEELRAYLGIIAVSVVLITVDIMSMTSGVLEALNLSFFQVASIITTTGYATTDFNTWPLLSKCILVLLMVLGASAGSTGGGIKTARVLIMIKSLRSSMQKMTHPRSVKTIKLDGKPIDENTINGVTVYMIAYSIIFAVSVLIISLDNFDFETTVTAVIATLNNIGPGLGMVGASGNFSQFSVLSKLVLSADMLFGRLELFPVMLLFVPSVWKRSK